MESTSPNASGFFLVGHTTNGITTELDGADASHTQTAHAIFPVIGVDPARDTRISVVNPGSAAAVGSLKLQNRDGSTLQAIPLSIPARGVFHETIQATAVPGGGYAELAMSNGRVSGLEKFGGVNALACLAAQDVERASSILLAPHVASGRAGARYYSEVNIVNTSVQGANVTFHLLSDDRGESVSPVTRTIGAKSQLQYDVFLVQARGRRRWQIAQQRPAPDNVLPDVDLRIMARFEPDTEWVAEPGDVLYLPPGIPHWGVAQGDCMTYSVGFRAPSLREIASSWFETVLETVPEAHYRDGELRPQPHGAEIGAHGMSRAVELIDALIERSDDQKRRWFGRYVTEPKPNLVVDPREHPLPTAEFRRRLEELGTVRRHPFSRFAHYGGDDGRDWLFVAGEEYRIDSRQRAFAQVLCQWRDLHFGYVAEWIECADYLGLMTRLFNAGHLEFPGAD